MEDKMQKIVSLAKRRGFIFPSSEIYGGVEALWDYGPLGALMKNNIKRAWIKRFVQERLVDVALIDASIIMHPKVWEASGHLKNFSDPLVECKKCHARFREDMKPEACTQCKGKVFTPAKQFNLMFKTFLGPVEDNSHVAYLRPETAQAMFADFKLVQETYGLKIPFGIAQVGKAFRNEITTGNFIFRAREFEIAEIEYFVKPGDDEKQFDSWLKDWKQFLVDLGLKEENLRLYEHKKDSLAHYSKRTVDIEYKFPFGWGEIAAVANRTDYDLKQHASASGKDLSYFDEETKKPYTPFVIEPTLGVDRLFLALLCQAYEEIKGGRTTTTEAVKETETVLRLNKTVAPVQVAVLPLVKNKPELVAKAREVYDTLKKHFMCEYHGTGAIGRRYRRQDEIGTPFAVTVDFESLEDKKVTLRDRDTMKQERIKIEDLAKVIAEKLYV